MMNNNVETREFQTEITQLLDIVINSLYTEREIFLRELISNAADATEKLRYCRLTENETCEAEQPLEIYIDTDEEAHTITITDNGIGMTHEDLIENLGTIAHSGSKEFIKQLTEYGKVGQGNTDLSLIGQFGVGFYSAFMVADTVTIYTRSFRPGSESWIWTSQGTGSYSIEPGDQTNYGTKIVLHLKENAYDFCKADEINRIIKQYSGFVPYPVKVNGEKVNTVQAIWTKNASEISDEEYTEFYKYIDNAYDEPLYRMHFTADAPLAIKALLFVPGENFERFGFSKMERGVNLYCKKVMIQEKSEAIVPEWMRFVRGVIDSDDLPLNISRETLQDNALIAKLNRVVTARFLKFLEEKAKDDAAKYNDFWRKFDKFLKEGAASDYTHCDALVRLLRYESNMTGEGELISLEDYVSRMRDEQKAIYYVSGANRQVIESGPYLEIFKDKGIEVLYTYEPIDDYILSNLPDFKGKKMIAAEQDSADLPDMPEEDNASASEIQGDELNEYLEWFKQTLGDRVTEVRASKRLVDSPAVVLSAYGTHSMQKMMQIVNKDLNNIPAGILEINSKHPVIKGINELRKSGDLFASAAAEQVLENSQIAAGLIIDPSSMVNRLYSILERAVEKKN
ncbi:molecular chaperone HtpG [Dehalobacter sp. DCM]|uniref:molecular chaperone HtpG n=1 Tax=Dehalobacter sp. DCM TaxID=2907827 RepID=UPI003081AEA8|nr:molecular chaperone HtpG [Dehalobacter sp. DCM]